MSFLWPCYFSCYTYQYMFLWYSSKTYNIITSTSSYYSWRFHATVKPRKYCVSIYHTWFLATWYIHDYVWYWWRTYLRYIHPVRINNTYWCHIRIGPTVSRHSIPAYNQLRILRMYGTVSHCSYYKCTTTSKLMSMPRYSPIANLYCILYEIT